MRWNEHQLETRDSLITYFTRYLGRELGKVNAAFRFMRIETPILLPFSVDKGKLQTVVIRLDNEDLVLRENTITGAYEASREILSGKTGPKQRLPIVVWQHGKVFERINNKIRESYKLEYQILYSKTTGMPYEPVIAHACSTMIQRQCGEIEEKAVPGAFTGFAKDTKDQLIQMRYRDDFWAGNNIEVIVDMDHAVMAALRQEKTIKMKRA